MEYWLDQGLEAVRLVLWGLCAGLGSVSAFLSVQSTVVEKAHFLKWPGREHIRIYLPGSVLLAVTGWVGLGWIDPLAPVAMIVGGLAGMFNILAWLSTTRLAFAIDNRRCPEPAEWRAHLRASYRWVHRR